MRFRLGAIVGFGAGYYLGARAGRERYEQLNRWMRRAQSSDAFETAAEKARAVIDLGVERAKDAVSDLRDSGGDSALAGDERVTNGNLPTASGPFTSGTI